MITFLLIAAVLILAIGLTAMAWSKGNSKRKDQGEVTSETMAAGKQTTGRATGPD